MSARWLLVESGIWMLTVAGWGRGVLRVVDATTFEWIPAHGAEDGRANRLLFARSVDEARRQALSLVAGSPARPEAGGSEGLTWTSPNGGSRLLWRGSAGSRELVGLLEPARELNRGGQWDLVFTWQGRELRAQGGRMSPDEALVWATEVWQAAHPVGPLVIDLDCDGPVSDYVGAATRFLYDAYSELRECWAPDPDVWDLRANLPDGGLDSHFAKALNAESARPGFVLGLDVVEGAVEGIAALRAHPAVELHVVTTSWPGAPYWPGERERWLGERVDVPAHMVTFTAHKARLDGDVLVDDKYETLVAWKRKHPAGVAILWRARWNRRYHRTPTECLHCPEALAHHATAFGGSCATPRPGERDPAILAVDGWRDLLPLLLSLADARRGGR